jgi:hypothetical protein
MTCTCVLHELFWLNTTISNHGLGRNAAQRDRAQGHIHAALKNAAAEIVRLRTAVGESTTPELAPVEHFRRWIGLEAERPPADVVNIEDFKRGETVSDDPDGR